jgi:hypothetical protein
VAASAGAQTLLAVHEHLRQELDQLREIMGQVAAGRAGAERARSHLHHMTMRQNYWTFGAFCAAYCRVVTVHHPSRTPTCSATCAGATRPSAPSSTACRPSTRPSPA